MNMQNPLPVAGYTAQSTFNVEFVNRMKAVEEGVLRQLDAMRGDPAFDQHMVSIATTKIQEAFMWANRAVFQPTRIRLPGDPE